MTVKQLIDQLTEYGNQYGFDQVVRVYVSAPTDCLEALVEDALYVHDEYALDNFIEIQDVDMRGMGSTGVFIRTKELNEDTLVI